MINNPNWQEANQFAVLQAGRGFKLKTNKRDKSS